MPAYNLESHVAFNDVNPEQYDGLIMPGGCEPEYIRMFNEALNIVIRFLSQ
ncbi:DJ-1/PfpI family protein [Rossellomorea sp. DUT-2]|uniref:DJ-1/PfpI family protein n=1 Tax=Rossellomorea sp. DUT-2 TaxID=3412021 RepID=UPI003D1698DF